MATKVMLGDKEFCRAIEFRTEEKVVVPETQYGLSIKDMFPDPDRHNTLRRDTGDHDIVLSDGVHAIGQYALMYRFIEYSDKLTFSAPKVTTITRAGMQYTFYNSGLVSVDMPLLKNVGSNGLDMAFAYSKLTELILPALITVNTAGAKGLCSHCYSLETVEFPQLETIEEGGLADAFNFCSRLKEISFPSLKSVAKGAFCVDSVLAGSVPEKFAFQNTGLQDIYFPKAIQDQIEATVGYDTQWGATNATIHFIEEEQE